MAQPPALSPKPIGLLVVIVLKAQHLPDKHKFSKSDPYCVVQLEDSGRKSTKWDKGGGQHPLWDEEMRFPVYAKEGEVQRLRLSVWAKESGEDDLLGEGEVMLGKQWRDNEFDDWIPLTLEGKERGQVFLEMTYYPNVKETKPLNLARRPSKLSPQDRLSRPLPTPPKAGALHRPGATPHPRISSLAPPLEEMDDELARRTASMALESPTTRPGQLPFPGDPEPPMLPAWLKPGRPMGGESENGMIGAGPGRAGWEGTQGEPQNLASENSQQQQYPTQDQQYDYNCRTSGTSTTGERPLYSPAQQYSPALPPQQYPIPSIPPSQPYPAPAQPYVSPPPHQQPPSPFVLPSSHYQYPSPAAPLQSPSLAPSLPSPSSYPSISQHPYFRVTSPAPPLPPGAFPAPPPPAASQVFTSSPAAQPTLQPPHYFPPVPPRPPSITPEMPGAYHVPPVEPPRPPRTPSATYIPPISPPTPPLLAPSPSPPPKPYPPPSRLPPAVVPPPLPSKASIAPSRVPLPPPATLPLRAASPPHRTSPLPSSSCSPAPSRAHLGQLALEQRIQQEREDARLAAQWAVEDRGEEEEMRRRDEEMARMLSEEGEEVRRREEEDERLARALAERED